LGFLRKGSAVVVSIFSDEGDDTTRLEFLPPPQVLSDCVLEHDDDPFFGEGECRLEWWTEVFTGFGHPVSFVNFGPTYRFESDKSFICGVPVTLPGPCNPFGSPVSSIMLLQELTCSNSGSFVPIEQTSVVDDPTSCEPAASQWLSSEYEEAILNISAGG
jgi:hypothetical protein